MNKLGIAIALSFGPLLIIMIALDWRAASRVIPEIRRALVNMFPWGRQVVNATAWLWVVLASGVAFIWAGLDSLFGDSQSELIRLGLIAILCAMIACWLAAIAALLFMPRALVPVPWRGAAGYLRKAASKGDEQES